MKQLFSINRAPVAEATGGQVGEATKPQNRQATVEDAKQLAVNYRLVRESIRAATLRAKQIGPAIRAGATEGGQDNVEKFLTEFCTMVREAADNFNNGIMSTPANITLPGGVTRREVINDLCGQESKRELHTRVDAAISKVEAMRPATAS